MLKTLWTPPTCFPSAVTRISCVAYMANFVARAQFVSLRSEALCAHARVYAVVWFVCMCMDGHNVLYTCVQSCPGVPVCPHPVGPPVSAQTTGSPSVASGSGPSCVCSARYIDSVSEDQLKPDIHCHVPFYSACQVLCLERVCPALHEQPHPLCTHLCRLSSTLSYSVTGSLQPFPQAGSTIQRAGQPSTSH